MPLCIARRSDTEARSPVQTIPAVRRQPSEAKRRCAECPFLRRHGRVRRVRLSGVMTRLIEEAATGYRTAESNSHSF